MPEAHIEMEAEDGCIDAFAVCPDGAGPWPPILLLSDSRGLRPAVEAMARRLAGEGCFVLAPNLFYRTGAGSSADARRAAVALRLAAVHAERIAAAAVFYGGRPSPAEAHHLAGCVNAVLHLGHAAGGGAEDGVLEAALRREGVDFESLVYPAPRGFAVPDHPGYEPAAAERHWTNLTELFHRTLILSNFDVPDPAGRSEDGILPPGTTGSLL